MERDELAGWLRLTLTPGVGSASARKLLAAFGLPDAIFQQPDQALRNILSAAQVQALRGSVPGLQDQLETTWQWLNAPICGGARRSVVVLGDPDYPASLLELDDPPLMLYLLGSGRMASDVVSQPCIAIVGSRNPTPQGATNARQFASTLAQAGLCVVSGLALGIDGAAHAGALDALGPQERRLVTVAVVGTGLDRVYPKGHHELAHRISESGMLVSEYPLGTPPLAANFPKRNRMIAGLTQGVLVVEAALKSGSLITARLAVEQGKDVFAIPGSIHSPQARGCHALIKHGAKLVESAQDVLEELNIAIAPSKHPELIANNALTEGAAGIFDAPAGLLDALGFDPVTLDVLQARCGIDTATLQAQLMGLELEGLITRLPGGLFLRLHRG